MSLGITWGNRQEKEESPSIKRSASDGVERSKAQKERQEPGMGINTWKEDCLPGRPVPACPVHSRAPADPPLRRLGAAHLPPAPRGARARAPAGRRQPGSRGGAHG